MIKTSENIYTKDFAYLIGLILSGSCLYTNVKNGCYQFSIASEDRDFCEKCNSIIKNIFNKEGKIKIITNNEKISYYKLIVCSKEIVYFLKEITEHRQIIPSFIFFNNEFKKEFVKGCVDNSGWISRINASDGYIRYRVGFKNSAEWTKYFRILLYDLGIKVGKIRKVYYSISTKNSYTFSINTYDYCIKIGFGIKRKEKLQKEFLKFYKNGGNKNRYENREIYKHRSRYKLYRIFKKCPICNKKYNHHWKVINHIRKTHDEKHQDFLKKQENEVYKLFMENDGRVEELADKLYLNKNIFCGISYTRIVDILEKYISRDEIRKIQRKRISNIMKTVPKTAEHNRKVSIAVKKAWKMGKFHTEKNIRARELGYKKRRSFAGKNNPMFGKPCPRGAGFGKGGKRKDLNNQYFRSTWEANLARICKLKNRPYKYEPERFYITVDGEECSYLPDFYFPTKKFYYEIKGHATSSTSWICPCDNCTINRKKIKATKEKYGIKILIIGNYEYKRLRRIFKESIKNWEK